MSGSSAKGARPRTALYHFALAPTSETRSCTCDSPVMGALSPASSTEVTRRSLVRRRWSKLRQVGGTSRRARADHGWSPPIMTAVLIHGGGATGGFWDRLLPYLDH